MGLDLERKERLAPRYKPREKAENRGKEPNQVFNDAYLEHHNIRTLKWKTNQNEKKDGDTDDG